MIATEREPVPAGPPRGRRFPVAPVLLALVFTALAAATWQRWGHVRIDTGGALERAALLAGGAVLYRDVLSPYGPVAEYAMAFLFRTFGVHLDVAYAVGLGLLAAESALLWSVARRFLGALECAVGLAAFWVVLGFAPGPFAWILPNTFASTWGAFFATAALAVLAADLDCPGLAKLVAASVCIAAAGLSKVEFGVAAFGAAATHLWLSARRGRERLIGCALVVLPGLLLSLAMAAPFVALVPWRELVDDNLYRVRSLGPSVTAYNATSLPPFAATVWRASVRYGVELPLRAALVAAGLGLAAGSGVRRWLGVLLAGGALLLPLLPGYPPLADFTRAAVPWQFAWTPAVWLLVFLWSVFPGRDRSRASTGLALVGAFSVLLSLRWGGRLLWPAYYGVFAPFLAVGLVRTIAARAGGGRAPLAAALVLALPTVMLAVNHRVEYGWQSFAVVAPRGTLWTLEPEGRPLQGVIDYVRAHTSPGDSVAVLPEERLINFLAERPHPTPDPGVGPGWLATPADVERFVRQLETRQPRLVVVSNRRYPEFRAGEFGSYCPDVMRWLEQHYVRVWTTGSSMIRYDVYAPATPP